MIRDTERVRVEAVDWLSALPVLHIFKSCRMALGPGKMLLALAIVVLAYLGGRAFDLVAGRRVSPDEIEQYRQLSPQAFEDYLESREEREAAALRTAFSLMAIDMQAFEEALKSRDRYKSIRKMINDRIDAERNAAMNDNLPNEELKQEQRVGYERRRREQLLLLESLRPRGVFDAAFEHKMATLRRLGGAAAAGELGFGDWIAGSTPAPNTVAGAVRELCYVIPCWLCCAHPVFLVYFTILSLALWAIGGGAISRLAALHATRDERMPMITAIDFAASRVLWFALSPLLSLVIAGVLALLLVAGGFVFFNVAVLDIVGGAVYGLALLLGLIVTAILVMVALAWPLLHPAVAVEGTDSFDAIARAFGYVIGRPWRWLGYTLTALAFGVFAVTLAAVFVGAVVNVTHGAVAGGVFTEADAGYERFKAIAADDPHLDWSAGASSWMVGLWVRLAWGAVAAYGVSFLLCSQTWVYLLLRRSADGTEFDDVYIDDGQTRRKLERAGPAEVSPQTPPAGTDSADAPPASPSPQSPPAAGDGSPAQT